MNVIRTPFSGLRSAALPVLALLAACQDGPGTVPTEPRPSFDISEARFGDLRNPDIFFAPPLAATPSEADEGFDAGAANGALRPYVRVCETDGQACVVDVTQAVTGEPTGLEMAFNPTGEVYQVGWKTNALDVAKTYRIEIWGVAFQTDAEKEHLLAMTFPAGDPFEGRSRWLFGWRDIANSPSVSACHGDEEFCMIKYGQNIPVKVRIEDYVLCPTSRNCAVQFVAANENATLQVQNEEGGNSQLLIPGQEGTDFPLGFEPCTAEERATVQGYAAIPTFGQCLKTLVPFNPGRLQEPALLSFCFDYSESIHGQLAWPAEQEPLVTFHHFNTGGDPSGAILNMEALPHAAPVCQEPTSGGSSTVSNDQPRRLGDFALATGKRLLSLFAPEPVVALDIGGGGEMEKLWSFFMLGLPAKFEYLAPGDAQTRGLAGGQYTLRAKATDLFGRSVLGARVDWSPISSPGGASVGVTPVLTGADGIAQTTVTLSQTEGYNVFHASGRGIADPRESGCSVIGGVPGTASCNGPRVAPDQHAYDPFQPHTSVELGGIQIIPEGTHLPFTVYGCSQGRGTATPDGLLSPGEWDCANSTTFPVNLSGGATQATLYWMNDGANMHIAVRVPGSARENALRIDWDNNGNAPLATLEGGSYTTAREAGDDIWEFSPSSGRADKFVDVSCSGSSQSGCGSNDASFNSGGAGANQTSAGFNNSLGGFTTYEISHPLNSGDKCTYADARKGCGTLLNGYIDLQATAGDTRGFFVTLRTGSGAQGNTQWPGFLRYMKVVIR